MEPTSPTSPSALWLIVATTTEYSVLQELLETTLYQPQIVIILISEQVSEILLLQITQLIPSPQTGHVSPFTTYVMWKAQLVIKFS